MRTIALAVLMLLVCPVFAQNATVSGRVIDQATREPVRAAPISYSEDTGTGDAIRSGRKTDSHGRFRFQEARLAAVVAYSPARTNQL